MAEVVRRWHGLDPLLWAVMTLACGLVLCLNIVPRTYQFTLMPGTVSETSHGWPLAYVVRLAGYSRSTGRLPLTKFNVRALGLNALIGIGLMAVAAGLAQRWRERRNRWHQIGIIEMILAISLLSIGLGARKWRQDQQLASDNAATHLIGCGLGFQSQQTQLDRLLTKFSTDGPRNLTRVVEINNSSRSGWFSSDEVLPTVGDAELESLRQLPYLERLDIPYEAGNRGPFATVKITDTGLRHFRSLRRLKELNIANQPITDAGLAAIFSLRELRYLDIQGTPVSADGVAALRRANSRLIVIGP